VRGHDLAAQAEGDERAVAGDAERYHTVANGGAGPSGSGERLRRQQQGERQAHDNGQAIGSAHILSPGGRSIADHRGWWLNIRLSVVEVRSSQPISSSISDAREGHRRARVKGYAEMLLALHTDGDLTSEMLERSLKRIDNASDRLASLVRDLLDVSRISAGNLPLRVRPLELTDLVHDVCARYQEQLAGTGHLLVDIVGLPGLVALDPGAELLVRVEPKARGVLLEVQDRGIGLPPGAAERIFEPFSRATNAEERQISGMGLGLYICRNIVEQHRGRIWAPSQGDGEGMLVSVWLPRAGAAAQVAGEAA
jgi:hypothetical protein